VFDGCSFDWYGGDVSLDEGVEAGDLGLVRVYRQQVGVGEYLAVQEVLEGLAVGLR
jgi:hypothetical protein